MLARSVAGSSASTVRNGVMSVSSSRSQGCEYDENVWCRAAS